MVATPCAGELPDGRRCRSWPIRGEPHCLWHSPDRDEEAADARRLGGLRRRREKAVSGAFDFVGLDSVQSIRGLLEIASIDTLGLENSIDGQGHCPSTISELVIGATIARSIAVSASVRASPRTC